MPDAVYKQALDIVATDVKTLADAIDANLTTQASIPVRALDWSDIGHNLIQICFDEDAIEYSEEGTNERDHWMYPCYVMFALPKRPHWDTLRNNVHKLKQQIRRHFNNKRRMSTVSDTGTNANTTKVTDRAPEPPADFKSTKDVHGLTVWARFLEPRLS